MENKERLITLYKDGFPEDTNEYINYFLNDKAKNIFLNKTETSVAYLINKKFRYCKKNLDLPYLVAVSTLKNNRGTGEVREVILNAIEFAKNINAPFVALFPFNHEYYKKYGFVTIDKQSECIILPDYKLELTKDYDTCCRLYNENFKNLDSYIDRNNVAMKLKMEEEEAGGSKCYLIKFHGEFIGYVIKNENIVEGVPFQFSELPNIQFRLANIEEALKNYEFDSSKAHFKINIIDNFLGNKIYSVRILKGKCSVEESLDYDFSITQEVLTELLLKGESLIKTPINQYFTKKIVHFFDKY